MTEECSFRKQAHHAATMAHLVFTVGRLDIDTRSHLETMLANIACKGDRWDEKRFGHFGKHGPYLVFTT